MNPHRPHRLVPGARPYLGTKGIGDRTPIPSEEGGRDEDHRTILGTTAGGTDSGSTWGGRWAAVGGFALLLLATAACGDAGSASSGSGLEVELGSDCVEPGNEQTIEVRARPGTIVLYQAVYSDGSGGLSPDYAGGNDSGRVGEDGSYAGRWTVGESAPPGPVRVEVVPVGGDHDEGRVEAAFLVAESGDGCR